MTVANYNEDSIRSLDWKEHIRLRPGMYIGKIGNGSSPDDGVYVLLKEVRAWTITDGMKAPQAAAVIHTDFEKGFIRAEVISYNDFVNLGSEQACRDAGKLSIEGKDYLVKDGDIMHFRFNV